MKNPLMVLYGVLAFLWMLLASFFCNKYCNCGGAAAAVPAVVAPMDDKPEKAISIADTDLNFSAGTNDNLLFPINSCDYIEPVSAPLTNVFQEAVMHLQNNASRILVLTGLYKGMEANECADSQDLGFGRAERVKSMLIAMGAPEAQIRTQSETRDVAMYDNNVLGGVAYEFISGDVGDVEERLRMGNITLYFETNERNLTLNSNQRKYFDDLKFYLTRKPDAKIDVSGHTDDRGPSYNYNKRLSRKRAEFVRDYMVQNGIPRKNLVSEGFGPDQPIATNDTEEGRAKNRRVEVKIQ